MANCGEYYRFLNSPSFCLDDMLKLFPWLDHVRCREILETHSNKMVPHSCGRYRRWQLFDAGTYLVDNNLTRVDRASMAFGLEVRVPFLDHRIVEFAFSLPENLCIADNETKVLLRHLANRRLQPHSVAKLKQGFSCPIERYWPAKKMAASIRNGSLVAENIVCSKQIDRLLDAAGSSNTPYQIWVLAALERWCQRWLCGCAVS